MVVVGEHSGELGPGGLNRRATTLGWSDESSFGEGGCDSGGDGERVGFAKGWSTLQQQRRFQKVTI